MGFGFRCGGRAHYVLDPQGTKLPELGRRPRRGSKADARSRRHGALPRQEAASARQSPKYLGPESGLEAVAAAVRPESARRERYGRWLWRVGGGF